MKTTEITIYTRVTQANLLSLRKKSSLKVIDRKKDHSER